MSRVCGKVYNIVLLFSFQIPVLGAAQEPDGDGRKPEPVGRDSEVHRGDPDLGRPKRQLSLRVSECALVVVVVVVVARSRVLPPPPCVT